MSEEQVLTRATIKDLLHKLKNSIPLETHNALMDQAIKEHQRQALRIKELEAQLAPPTT